MFKTIVWATDGSDLADGALDYARELARLGGSRIIAVHANEVRTGRYGGESSLADEPDLRGEIEQQVEQLQSASIDATFDVRAGAADVATLITDAAADEQRDDLESEKRAYIARWKKREKQIERLEVSSASTYGDLQE
jgi:nucleotide-binding universal stress UspA family protein